MKAKHSPVSTSAPILPAGENLPRAGGGGYVWRGVTPLQSSGTAFRQIDTILKGIVEGSHVVDCMGPKETVCL